MSELTEKDWMRGLRKFQTRSGESPAKLGIVIECRMPFPISPTEHGQFENMQACVDEVLERARQYGAAEVVDVIQLKPNES